jgi:hypothetical protein
MAKKIHPAKVLRTLKTKPTPDQVRKARRQRKLVDRSRKRQKNSN